MTDTFHDPYGGCEDTCSHDLARGASAKDLRDGDGPYPADHPLFATDPNLRRWIASRLAETTSPVPSR